MHTSSQRARLCYCKANMHYVILVVPKAATVIDDLVHTDSPLSQQLTATETGINTKVELSLIHEFGEG